MDTFRCSATTRRTTVRSRWILQLLVRLHNCCLHDHHAAQRDSALPIAIHSLQIHSHRVSVCASASYPFTEMQRMDLQLALRYTRYILHNRPEEPIFIGVARHGSRLESNHVFIHDLTLACIRFFFLHFLAHSHSHSHRMLALTIRWVSLNILRHGTCAIDTLLRCERESERLLQCLFYDVYRSDDDEKDGGGGNVCVCMKSRRLHEWNGNAYGASLYVLNGECFCFFFLDKRWLLTNIKLVFNTFFARARARASVYIRYLIN